MGGARSAKCQPGLCARRPKASPERFELSHSGLENRVALQGARRRVVGKKGLEPIRNFSQQILSLRRLPIPPNADNLLCNKWCPLCDSNTEHLASKASASTNCAKRAVIIWSANLTDDRRKWSGLKPGAFPETRTRNIRFLKPARLPIAPGRQNLVVPRVRLEILSKPIDRLMSE